MVHRIWWLQSLKPWCCLHTGDSHNQVYQTGHLHCCLFIVGQLETLPTVWICPGCQAPHQAEAQFRHSSTLCDRWITIWKSFTTFQYHLWMVCKMWTWASMAVGSPLIGSVSPSSSLYNPSEYSQDMDDQPRHNTSIALWGFIRV